MRILLRSLRHSRSLLLLFSALVVAVTAMTSVAFFVDRVDRGLVLQGAALLAADLVIEQGNDIPAEWLEQARQLGLETSEQVSFPSVLFHEDRPVLVQVKAVDGAYPLRGELQVSGSNGLVTAGAPPAGHLYLENNLRDKLQLAADFGAATAPVFPLGELSLQLAGYIEQEPDRGGNLFQLAPRIMLNSADVQASGLLGPASRARYRLLLAGDSNTIAQYRRWLTPRLPHGSRVLDVENARPELRTALDRGRRFLSLAALCASLLAGIAILLAARRYVSRAMDTAAILRTLGMTGWQVMWRHLREIALVLVSGVVTGIVLGYLGQMFLFAVLGEWFSQELPVAGPRPVLTGVLFGTVLLLGFALPALLRIRRVSPLRVLRRELDPPDASALLVWGLALVAFTLLVFWQVQDNRLATSLLLALAAIMLLSVGIGRGLIALLRPYRKSAQGVGFGLAALSRHAALTQWQLAGFSVGISLLLLLGAVRVDLINTWQRSLSPAAPNHFLINIQPDEQQALQQWFKQQGISNSGMYASARGRLTQIDGQAIDATDFATPRARHLATREFSLGFSDRLQSDNRIVAGQPWRAGWRGFSVELGLAQHLGLKPGSQLTFEIAGQQLTAPVVNLRTVSWDSFNVNFFVQGSQDLMADLPVAYLNSIYLTDENSDVVRKLARDYPAMSVLDLRPLLAQVRNIMDKGALAVQGVFVFTLLAAVLVTLGAVQISREERAREIALLRTLGASRGQVLLGVLSEFGLLGLLAGLIAASLSAIAGYVIALQLFDLQPAFNPWIWLAGMSGGLAALLTVGYLASRSLLTTPPMAVLNTGN
ncbi:MAG: FtsX-like permease family protein [Chromatiales bacterium]|jgi:putative ABC transport system permease protein